MRPNFSALYFIAFFPFAQNGFAQDASEVINNYCRIVSNGDVKNWDKIGTIYYETVTASYNNHQGNDFNLKTPEPTYNKEYFSKPATHVLKSYRDSSFLIFSVANYFFPDTTVTIIGNMTPRVRPTSGRPKDYDFPPTRFMRWLKEGKTRYTGLKKFPNETASFHEIEVRTGNGFVSRHYFNAETFLYEYSAGSGNGISTMTHYFNYERYGDYLMPMDWVDFVNEKLVSSHHIKKVIFNCEIDPKELQYE